MNSFGSAPMRAMLTGAEEGQRQAAILPNSYQVRGKAQPTNPFQGSLDMICKQLMEIASAVGDQGDAHRECKVKLYKAATDIAKANNELTDIAEGDEESAEQRY